jgi:hypothetical protein
MKNNSQRDALANPAPCPVTGKVTDNEIKIILGKVGGVWPASIEADVFRADAEHAEKLCLADVALSQQDSFQNGPQ